MADVDINKFRASVVREGSKPASPGFIVSEGQSPTDPAGSGQNHLPVTIATAATGLSITESQVLGGAGTVGQYIRGDGSLADFPESSGGGSSVSYYLNGSVSQGTIGGVAYKELNKVPILGAGTDFTINADGYIASFLTDAGDPNLLEIPGGNWNFETYFSSSSSGGSPTFYVELYKVNSGGTATLIASNSTFPELIAFGTNIISYFSTLAVPTTTLALTDRLAIRYYVTHSGRTITLHTEDNHLCQIITTFTTGLTALNGLTAQIQNFAVGTSGTDFAISSATATHTFNLPTASATNRGALSSADWTTFNSKQNALTNPVTGTGTTNYLPKFTGANAIGNSLIFDNGTQVGINTNTIASDFGLALFGSKSLMVFQNSNTGQTNSDGFIVGSFGGTEAYLFNYENAAIVFGTNGQGRMRIFDDGNVFIGSSPSNAGYKLEVNGNVRFNGIMSLENDGTYGSTYKTLGFTGNSNGSHRIFAGTADDMYFAAATARGFQFWTNGSTTTRMTITSGGNVGIGTTTPDVTGFGWRTLTIRGGTTSGEAGVIELQSPTTTGAANLGIIAFMDGSNRNAQIGVQRDSSTTTANMLFYTNSGSGIVERMRITSAGQLLVNSQTSANDNVFKFFIDSTFASIQATYNTTGSYVPMRFLTSDVERMRIMANGDVYFGNITISVANTALFFTKSNGNIIQVFSHSSGTVTIQEFYKQGSGLTGSITYNGTLTLYNQTSDYRLKEDLQDYNALQILGKLKTYDFKWKNTNTRDFGMLAHELQEVLPNYVSGQKDELTDDKSVKPQLVDYSKIVPLLIKSIQELKKEIDTLKN